MQVVYTSRINPARGGNRCSHIEAGVVHWVTCICHITQLRHDLHLNIQCVPTAVDSNLDALSDV